VAAIAVHVVDLNVVSTGDSDTIILVDDDTVANLGIIGAAQSKAIAVMCCRQTVGAVVGRISGAVVQRDVVNVQTSAVTDTEAVHWVILDVDVVDGTLPKNLLQFDEVIRLGDAAVAADTIPPSLTVAIEYSIFVGSDFKVGSSYCDKSIVCIRILPESPSFERDLGSSL
jgi:hypothetical protein